MLKIVDRNTWVWWLASLFLNVIIVVADFKEPQEAGGLLVYRNEDEHENNGLFLDLLHDDVKPDAVKSMEGRLESDLLDQTTLIKLHGTFMVVAWMGTTTIGVLIARYFKRTWTKKQLFGTQAWFFWHRTCMMFTWSLTMTAFIMIFIDVDGWSVEEMPHAVLGTITTVICFLHPILATFRPALGSAKRKYFNMGHAFGGQVAQILALVTIFLAVNMPKAELPAWLFFVLAAFVLCQIAAHIYFTYMAYKAENHPQYGNRDFDAPYSTYRKYGLIIAGIVFTGFVVTVITVIVLAPLPSL